ncbi:unnamed protein product [Durusdinium trenchii]|uniref:GAIN-B domain-containing protein n=1 Tax=Durusdinium trenchii TaxID=1381693 RepID=A0ABP0IRL4_9DINO
MAFILLTLSTWISVECARWGGPSVGGTSPAVRNKHTGVMDSAGKLWIFGGWGSGSGYLNDVHYLDTQDGTGTPTWVTPSVSGTSPTAREAHTSVMDASGKMWVFGGTDGSAVLDEVHSLDTQAGTPIWTTPSVSGTSPSARQRHSAVMDASGKMWVFGGWDGSGYFNDVHYLDTQAGTPTWTTPSVSGNSPETRNRHVSVMDGNGKMWIFGGWGPGNGYLNDVHYLDTQAATPTWTTPSISGTSPTGRERFAAVMDSSGKIWIFGGTDGSRVDELYCLDTQATGAPTWIAPLESGRGPSSRYSLSAVLDSSRRMWLFGGGFGGSSYSNGVYYLVAEAESTTWKTPAVSSASPIGRSEHTAVMDASGRMWIFAGWDGSSRLNDVHYLDTKSAPAAWTTPSLSGSSPSTRDALSAVMDASQKIWIFGGDDGSSFLNDVHYLDTQAATPTWTTPSVAGTNPTARYRHTGVMDASGKMWIFAGIDSSGYLNDVHYLDTQAGTPTWTTPSVSGTSPEIRNRHVAVMDGNGKMWIFGGWGPGNLYLNDVHCLDTQAATPTWTTPSLSGTSPSGREQLTALMDWSGKMWIFGGTDGSRFNELHYLDTKAGTPMWSTPLVSGTIPFVRRAHSAVYDGNGKMWIFGGKTDSGYVNEVYCREVSTTTTTSSSTTSSSTTSSSTTSSSTSTSTSTTATSSSSTSSSTSTSSTSSSASTSTLTSVTKTVTTTTSETTSKTASTTTTVSSSSSSTSVSFSSTTTSSRSTFTSSSLTTSTSSATVITSMSSTISATMTTGTSTVSATASTRISASTTSSTSTTTSTTSITTITITTTCTTTNNATTLSTAASSKVNLGTESYTRLQLREMEEQRQEQARLAVLNLDATESEVVQQVLSNLSNSNDGSTLAFLLEETRVGPTTFAAFSAAFSEAWPDSFTIPAIGGIVEISREVMQEVTSEAKIDGPVLVSITTINEELSAAFRSDEALGLRETYFELRSKLLSVNFWNEEGRRLKVTLMTPITLQLVDVEDENATCAFWDARASRWSKEGMETLPSDPTTLRCNVFHLTTFGAVTNRIARNIELSFQCSTFASLMDESAFSKLSEPKWLQHSSAILSIIFLILSLTAMSIAVWVDWRSKDKLPQHQREILLMRVNAGGRGRGAKKEKDATADDAQQETQQDILEHPTWRQTLRAACGNCMEFLGHATGDNAIEGVKELCANAEAASINKSISMLQSHRSGACQITIKVLEHDESEPVKRSRSRKVSLVRGALSVRQESSVQHQISKADVIYMKSAEVGAGAAEQFLRSNCFGRICALFPAVHAWLKVLRFSVVVSHSVRVMLIAMKIISAGALGALFFSTTEHTPESDPECVEPTDPFDQLVQTATVGLGTAVLGDGIILVFFLVQRRSVVERRRWTAGMKRRQRCCWRFRTMVFWILAISYFCYCQLYIWLFLANVSQESATSWFESLVVTLVQDFLLKPFILALVLGALTTLILCCRPRLKRQVLQKWKPIDEPSESVREDESNNALEEDDGRPCKPSLCMQHVQGV